MQLFHYHLVTSRVREIEARYLARFEFNLVARHGRLGEEQTSFEPGVSWDELDQKGFKLRLSELERGAVNVVVQPGQWEIPRVDHLGFACEDEEFLGVLDRATRLGLPVQEHGGRRTFIGTNAGYRLEVHPQRDWIDEMLAAGDKCRLAELHLRADDPETKATALYTILDLLGDDADVEVGHTMLRFVPGGPQGRPELHAERFV